MLVTRYIVFPLSDGGIDVGQSPGTGRGPLAQVHGRYIPSRAKTAAAPISLFQAVPLRVAPPGAFRSLDSDGAPPGFDGIAQHQARGGRLHRIVVPERPRPKSKVGVALLWCRQMMLTVELHYALCHIRGLSLGNPPIGNDLESGRNHPPYGMVA